METPLSINFTNSNYAGSNSESKVEFPCILCKNTPSLVTINKTNPEEVEIFCKDCNKESKISIVKYYKLITRSLKQKPFCEFEQEHSKKPAVDFCYQCDKWFCCECLTDHKKWNPYHRIINENKKPANCKYHNKLFEYFCLDCKSSICKDCIETHKKHNKPLITEYFNVQKFCDIKASILTVKEEYFEYIQSLKNNTIKYLNNKIQKIEELYLSNIERNQMLYNLFSFILKSYDFNRPDYFSCANINNNNFFKFIRNPEINLNNIQNKDIEITMDYLNTNLIYGQKQVNLANMSEIKSKALTEPLSSLLLMTKTFEIVVGCANGKMILYDFTNDKWLDYVQSDKSAISYISEILYNQFITCSRNGNLNIWEINNNKFGLIKSINYAHNKSINKVLYLKNFKIASCSDDMMIKIWNGKPPYETIQILKKHKHWVNSILELEHYLVSGSGDDDNLIFWNLSDFTIKEIVKGVSCCFRNSLIQIDNTRIAIGHNQSFTIVNYINFKIEKKVKTKGNGFVDAFSVLRNGNLLLGDKTGAFMQFELNKYEKVYQKPACHEMNICFFLSVNEEYFISGSFDNKIKLWKY